MYKSIVDMNTGLETIVEMTAEEIQEVQNTLKQETYAEKRMVEYPPLADYIDGIVKNDQQQIAKYIADCLAVKAKYPKE